jgi:drug/metabolite transporter (DMT)-like permease
VALLSGVLGTLFFTTALLQIAYIPFSVVFLVQKLQPVFTVIAARIVLSEPITRRYATWAGVALAAAYFVTFPNGVVDFATGQGQVTAAALAFLAAVSWGISTAFSRYVLLHHPYTVVTGLRFVLTVPIALLFVAGLGDASSLASITPGQLLTLTLIAVSTGMVAIWIYYRGLRTTEARVSTIVELAFPMTAVLIDYAVYGTRLEATQLIAAAVLLFAMYRVSVRS